VLAEQASDTSKAFSITLRADQDRRSQVSAPRMLSVAVQPVAAISIQVAQHSWNALTISNKTLSFYTYD
jgi:hypothetical protein